MKLSNKKRKFILCNAGDLSVSELGAQLHISPRQVQKVLGDKNRPTAPPPSSGSADWAFGFLLLLPAVVPHVFHPYLFNFANIPQMGAVVTGSALLVFLFFLGRLRSGHLEIRYAATALPVAAFIVWALAGIPAATNRYEAILSWLNITAAAVVFFSVPAIVRNHRQGLALMGVIFASGCASTLLVIGQHLFGISLIPQVFPPAATFANKNMAAHFLVLTLPLGFGFFLSETRPAISWFFAMMSGLMVVALIYIAAKGAWVSMLAEAICFLLLLWFMRKKSGAPPEPGPRKTAPLLAALLAALLLMNVGPRGLHWGIGDVVESATTMADTDTADVQNEEAYTSAGIRLAIWRNSLELIADHPLSGVGIGNFKIWYPRYHRSAVVERVSAKLQNRLSHAHNDYLQTAAETGIPGILILGVGLFLGSLAVLRIIRQHPSRKVRLVTISGATAIAGIWVNALFSFPFDRAVPPFVCMLIAGVLMTFDTAALKTYHIFVGYRWRIVLTVMALVVLSAVSFLTYREMRGDQFGAHVRMAASQNYWKGVIEEGQKAVGYAPWKNRIRSFMGRAYIEFGELEKGVGLLEKGLETYPNNANGLINLGVGLQRLKRYSEAAQAYEKAGVLAPEYGDIYFNLGNIYTFAGDLQKARRNLEKAAELQPQRAEVLFNLANIERREKKYEQAAAYLEHTVALKPAWAQAWKNLGAIYYSYLNQPEKGARLLQKALELDPRISEGDKIRALLQDRQKREAKPPSN